MNLIDFIYESNNSTNSNELVQVLLKFLNDFGIDRFMMAELSHDTTSDKEDNLSSLGNYPKEWLNHYVASHYVDYDPVYQKGLRATAPYTWEEVQKENISRKSSQVMEEAKEFKLCSGIGVSIHQPFGKITGIGFAGSENDARSDKDTLSQIYIASHQFLAVSSDLLNIDTFSSGLVNITDREREVLLWASRGKNKSAIAGILSVSESCIKRHCENVFIKLGTNNITSAVARSIRMGFIDPF